MISYIHLQFSTHEETNEVFKNLWVPYLGETRSYRWRQGKALNNVPTRKMTQPSSILNTYTQKWKTVTQYSEPRHLSAKRQSRNSCIYCWREYNFSGTCPRQETNCKCAKCKVIHDTGSSDCVNSKNQQQIVEATRGRVPLGTYLNCCSQRKDIIDFKDQQLLSEWSPIPLLKKTWCWFFYWHKKYLKKTPSNE